jgi:hypothetical protein
LRQYLAMRGKLFSDLVTAWIYMAYHTRSV